MGRIDELHLLYPFAGTCMLRGLLIGEGKSVRRRHVAALIAQWLSRRSIDGQTRRMSLRAVSADGFALKFSVSSSLHERPRCSRNPRFSTMPIWSHRFGCPTCSGRAKRFGVFGTKHGFAKSRCKPMRCLSAFHRRATWRGVVYACFDENE